MTHTSIIPLVAVIASLGLAVFVVKTRPRTELRQAFAFTAVALAFWNLTYVALYLIADRSLAFELSRIFGSGAMFLFPAILHLAIAAPERPRSRWLWRVLIADYVLFGFFVLANAFDLLVSGLRAVLWGYCPIVTRLYDLFAVMVIVNLMSAFALLIYEYRTTSTPRVRRELKRWLWAMGIAFPLGLTNLLPVYGIAFFPLGNFGSAVSMTIIGYAIVRGRLMGIDIGSDGGGTAFSDARSNRSQPIARPLAP